MNSTRNTESIFFIMTLFASYFDINIVEPTYYKEYCRNNFIPTFFRITMSLEE